MVPPGDSQRIVKSESVSSAQELSDVTTDISKSNLPFITQHEASCPLPEMIGDYQVLALIGKGGMGLVYQARHLHLNQFFAIKVIREHLRTTADSSGEVVLFPFVAARLWRLG